MYKNAKSECVVECDGGFEAYVTREEVKKGRLEWKKPRIEVSPSDTSASLQMKRSGGYCEFPGCRENQGLEWHHHGKTLAAGYGWGEVQFWGNVYRKITEFKSTNNPELLKVYSDTLQECTLLCKYHHAHTHTHTHLQAMTWLGRC